MFFSFVFLKGPDTFVFRWDVLESYFEGSKVKESLLRTDGGDAHVFDGKQTVIYSGINRHVTICAPGAARVHVSRLKEFRWVPEPDRSLYVVSGRTPDGLGIRLGTDNVTVDEAGLVKSLEIHDANGRLVKEIMQRLFVTYPGGITFPSLALEAT